MFQLKTIKKETKYVESGRCTEILITYKLFVLKIIWRRKKYNTVLLIFFSQICFFLNRIILFFKKISNLILNLIFFFTRCPGGNSGYLVHLRRTFIDFYRLKLSQPSSDVFNTGNKHTSSHSFFFFSFLKII